MTSEEQSHGGSGNEPTHAVPLVGTHLLLHLLADKEYSQLQ